ncbi:MAG: hypothetical protein GY757_16345 [bacterium]|nr:hypothetical protein [bacterium]
MKQLILLVTVIITIANLYPANQGELAEILKPETIRIAGDEAYIIEGATVFVYNLENMKLKRKFGRKGEGPGELKVVSRLSNTMRIDDRHVIVNSIDKTVYFTRNGKFVKEKKRSEQFTQMEPVKENYVVRKRVQGEDKKQYTTINIYNPKTKETKELYRQVFAFHDRGIDVVPDAIHFCIYGDKVFIEKSPVGIVIDVFDHQGKKLYQMESKNENVPLEKKLKKEATETIKVDPAIGNWDEFKSQIKLRYPENCPAIRDIVITGDKIYLQTYKQKNGQEQYIILDLKGKLLKKIYLPIAMKPSFTEQMMGTGVRFYAFAKDKFYYLEETEDQCRLKVQLVTK